MIKKLFLDESGECSFSDHSNYKHFLLAIISLDIDKAKIIKVKLMREFRNLIRKGWNKNVEIKASSLYKNRKFGKKSVFQILETLLKVESIQFHYLVVNKNRIENQSFRSAHYGIAYNYFSGVLLSELVFQDGFHEIDLTYDLRNKETHQKRHFKEQLETKIYGMSFEQGIPVEMKIEGLMSDKSYGLRAVDFISWSIFRRFESNDNRFFDKISGKIGRARQWYVQNEKARL